MTRRANRVSHMSKLMRNMNEKKLNKYLQESANIPIAHATSQNNRLKRSEGTRKLKTKIFRFSNEQNTVFGTNKNNTNRNINTNLSNALKEARESINITQGRVIRPRLTQNEGAMLAEVTNGKNSFKNIRGAILNLNVSNAKKLKLLKAAVADFHNL